MFRPPPKPTRPATLFPYPTRFRSSPTIVSRPSARASRAPTKCPRMSSPTTRSEEQPMSNPGMDADVFAQFIEQLQRYVRERLLPAEKEIVETDRIPDDILAEMRDKIGRAHV